MTIFWIILMVLIIAVPAVLVLRKRRVRKEKAQKAMTENLDIPNVPDFWANSELTPLGMRVIWNGDVWGGEEAKQRAFQCFDTGFRNLKAACVGKFPNWDFNPAYANIGILEPTATNMDGSKALMTKHGVQCAGATIGVGGDGYNMPVILIPSQKANGWTYADQQMRIIWHEGEHFWEWISDTTVFWEYSGKVPGGRPDNHPHHPLPPDVPEIPAPTV